MRRVKIPLLGDIVERSLNNFFERMGEFIGLHPLPFLIVPLLITALLTLGLIQARVESDVRILYTPVGAPSRYELKVSDEFFNRKNAPSIAWAQVLFYVADRPDTENNMLTKNRTDFVLNFHTHVTKHLNYSYGGQTDLNFGHEMCDKSVLCRDLANKQGIIFLNVINNPKLLRNPNIRMKYPVLDAFGIRLFLGFPVLGVPKQQQDLIAASSSSSDTNQTNQSTPFLTDAKLLRLQFLIDLKQVNKTTGEHLAFLSALRSYVDEVQGSEDIRIVLNTPQLMDYEVLRNAVACLPFLIITVIAINVFCVLSTLTADRVRSKPVEAFLGGFACLMAIISTLGLMFFCGFSFNSNVSVMPFLALAIGIDDTFLALSSWHSTDARLPVHKRLALSLRESGTAITVTSLTDVVLFGLCAISSTPAITVFSAFTAVAMAFDYVYQLTFFTAVMAYAGRREARKIHSCSPVCCWPKVIEEGESQQAPIDEKPISESIGDQEKRAMTIDDHPEYKTEQQQQQQLDLQLQFVQKKLQTSNDTHSTDELMVARLLRTKFAPALNHPSVKIFVLLIYIGYIILSFYGCSRMRIDMTPKKTLLDDSPMQEYLKLEEKYLWEYIQAQIFILRAPDFRNASEQAVFEQFLKELESTPYSLGNASTSCFYREFQNYIQYIDHKDEDFYENIKDFLEVYVHSYFKGSLHWSPYNNSTNYKDDPNATIRQFVFTTGFTAGDQKWEGKLNMLRAWRNISRAYPQFEPVIYEFSSCFVDQYDTLEDETIQQVGIALIGMTLMAAFFIPNLSSIFWVGWTLLSMDIGVVGGLVLWGCDLDAMVMMNIVMSLDFAVEYAAHVCHRYYVSREYTDAEKVIDTLAAVGWPVLQGGMAAIIAVLPLVFVRSYIVRAFFRTVVLVVGIGLVHALVFLPVFVSSVSRVRYLPQRSAAKVRRDLRLEKSKLH